ncbi:hypothetical protein C8T65DRAFT_737569 [Cerioporus squamosus]|nr:hypothetical protein C8T65DRAFT_737569 [Cerioporus squamosus]
MNAAAGLQRDTEVSFPDGNAIIIAMNVFFQIHKGVLARHSPVLAAELDNPIEYMDGYPVVRVTDTPYDIKQILRVAYGLSKSGGSAAEPISVLFAWLRVGTKYDMQQLVDDAYVALQTLFPANLSEWDERDGPEFRHNFKDENAIEALNLFQQTGQFEMVPAAVYRCCQLDPAVVLRGTTRADGTPERLTPKNIELIARAKERLKEHGTRMIEECQEKFEASKSCSYSWGFVDGCPEVISHLAYTEENGKESWRDGDPLDNRFMEYIDEQEDGNDYESREEFADCTGACSNCIEELREEFAAMRARVWNDLPAIAGVQDEIEDWAYDD